MYGIPRLFPLTSSYTLKVSFFPKSEFCNFCAVPDDLLSDNPDPSTWGLPYALFYLGSNCEESHFVDLQIIINLTFCGDWAGEAFITVLYNLFFSCF